MTESRSVRVALLAEIYKLQDHANVHLLFTSRHVPHILKDVQHAQIIEVEAADEDIKLYVRERFCYLPENVRKVKKISIWFLERKVEAASGM
ncbi:hypothetical protein BU23DRAFT_638464 [Bimuria novae-zelandiae CBS 107.79]|uniref:Uncharacterized protein n=1 Tax=Bimuria novae-zelandiae CBS 107.79 TaxID=1447943 RepID=A0A6A5V9Z0_9PLEO|nr:hypothetical protein BU23DRAFT_638464 [Bimuria novae-zelandiae CBS 107.79]